VILLIRVVIADDIALFRNGIKTLIELDKGISVVGCACNGKEAVELCEKYAPDVVLMDIKMPNMNGIEATRLIKKKNNLIKILILTTFYENEDISNAFEFGADGYVLKNLEQSELIMVVKNVTNGLNVFQSDVFDNVRKQYHTQKVPVSFVKKPQHNFGLNERELEIIQLIIEGKKNRDIAEKTFITEGSVKNIVSKIFKKLDLEDRTQLAIFAVKNHLFT